MLQNKSQLSQRLVYSYWQDTKATYLCMCANTDKTHPLVSHLIRRGVVTEHCRLMLYYSTGFASTNKSCLLTDGWVVCWKAVDENSLVFLQLDNLWKTSESLSELLKSYFQWKSFNEHLQTQICSCLSHISYCTWQWGGKKREMSVLVCIKKTFYYFI